MEESRAHQQANILVILLLFVFNNYHVLSKKIDPTAGMTNITFAHVNGSSLPLRRELVQKTNQDDSTYLYLPHSFKFSFDLWLNHRNLSGYGLEGPIPEFNQMQALQIINMDHNRLTGKIPDFLGNLTNLKLLNLSYNNLDPEVPLSLNTSTVQYDVTGSSTDTSNSASQNPEKKDPLEPLWGLLGLVVIVFGIWLFCYRKRKANVATVQLPRQTVYDHQVRTTVSHSG
ncbi:uncharacterized protein A4U43_C05F3990 [Asparagus officinalis]|uniref:Malectin-like domain-containing protein n=1 Tax=Asparagus officinalis TaxID=4686 RepID=A0A5P1EP68_ASPOF|nr:uncharacterized protein A4U43_C05F3990 [Asparagus officinalis]